MKKNLTSLFNSKVDRLFCCLLLGLAVLVGAPSVVMTQESDDARVRVAETTTKDLRAKARPDECYRGLGQNIPFLPAMGGVCSQGTPKVNQGYVWGMTLSGDDVWYGTASNPQCITQGGLANDPENLVPYETSSWACEFGAGPFSPSPLPAAVGDFRPPQIFIYNKVAQTNIDVTPRNPANPIQPLPLVQQTRGIRAAVKIGNLILLAGPALPGGVNFFAYRADTRAFIGARNFPEFNSIRQWTQINEGTYTGVGLTAGGGAVLKWLGTVQSPFLYERVGNLDSVGAFIASHEGRIFITTWPPEGGGGVLASLNMSPPVPEEGLTSADADSWTKVWQASDYEPDQLIAFTYSGGALASFDGYLYWGTMHVPYLATKVFFDFYDVPDSEEAVSAAFAGTFRTASVFRGRNFGGDQEIDLLYGDSRLPVYVPPSGEEAGYWKLTPNNTGRPLYGRSGFGYAYNTYTWSMAVWNDRLWVGTMDWSYLANEGFNLVENPPRVVNSAWFGGDLYYFPNSSSPALAESITGVGNHTSYGVRNILPAGDTLFLGMANPMNLLTDLNDDRPEGGWELLELRNTEEPTPEAKEKTEK